MKMLKHTSVPLLSKALNAYGLKQRAIANNIANVTTPKFKRKEVLFEELLNTENFEIKGSRTNEEHLILGKRNWEEIEPQVIQPKDDALVNGINNVDIDKEVVALTDNALKYRLSTTLMSMRLGQIKSSITERV